MKNNGGGDMSMYYVGNSPCVPSDELRHHGILGMKWGVRRFQNEDGTYTPAGRSRYGLRDSIGASIRNKVRDHQLAKAFGKEVKFTSYAWDAHRDRYEPKKPSRLERIAKGVKAGAQGIKEGAKTAKEQGRLAGYQLGMKAGATYWGARDGAKNAGLNLAAKGLSFLKTSTGMASAYGDAITRHSTLRKGASAVSKMLGITDRRRENKLVDRLHRDRADYDQMTRNIMDNLTKSYDYVNDKSHTGYDYARRRRNLIYDLGRS